jgi:hypothetical protein
MSYSPFFAYTGIGECHFLPVSCHKFEVENGKQIQMIYCAAYYLLHLSKKNIFNYKHNECLMWEIIFFSILFTKA